VSIKQEKEMSTVKRIEDQIVLSINRITTKPTQRGKEKRWVL